MQDIGVPGVSGAELIGQGAFGRVYKARQDALNRVVAVKILAHVDLDPESETRFAREARAVGRMSGHPNIVNVYAQGTTTAGAPYMMMEFCSGGSLGERIRHGGRLPWQEATAIVVAIAGALQTAHTAGILHRDIKPANILLDSYGTPKLADFGIARLSAETSLTETGVFAGSPAHMPPEVIAGAQATPASDVYSLASTLFALITGAAPFHRENDASILVLLQRIAAEPPPHLSQWGVPDPVADLVAAALNKPPEHRPRTCADFAVALMSARARLGLGVGDYRVERDGNEDDATVLPTTPSLGTPSAPGSANPPAPTFGGPTTALSPPPHDPMQQAMLLPGPGDARPSGRRAIVVSWVIVLLCVALTAWMLLDRAQRTAALQLLLPR